MLSLRTAVLGGLVVCAVSCTESAVTKEKVASAAASLIGTDPAQTINTTVTLNRYAALGANAAVGATVLSVPNVSDLDSATFGALAQDDLLMIIQMQGATIDGANTSSFGNVTNLNQSGIYEFIEVQSVDTVGKTITVKNGCGGLRNAYTTAGKTQIVRVPQLASLTVGAAGTITAPDWDGNIGGIVALHVQGTMSLAGTVDVSGQGFRGGDTDGQSTSSGTLYRSAGPDSGGEKGESIAGYQAIYDGVLIGGRYGRGAPANGGGGGNAYRGGGGGGANASNGNTWNGQGVMDPSAIGVAAWNLDPNRALPTSTTVGGVTMTNNSGGGRGGYTYSVNNLNATATAPDAGAWGGDGRREAGGLGGRPVTNDPLSRLFVGGGGGAGDGDTFTAGKGGRGGGLIYVMADRIQGAGAFVANGLPGASVAAGSKDSAGGGGAGGSVVIRANNISQFSISANGGQGGSQNDTADEAAGPGGGGGGGYIATSSGAGNVTRSAAGGRNGETRSNGLTEFPANGATRGADGITTGTVAVPTATSVNDIPLCLEPANLEVTVTDGITTATPGTDVSYTITVRNLGPGTATRARFTNVWPTALLGTVDWTCTGTCTVASGTGNIDQFVTLANGQSFTITATETINTTATGTISDVATVYSPPIINDPTPGNNTATDTDTLNPVANLGVSITTPTGNVDEDANILWTIRVDNAGPSQAAGVSVTFTIPSGVQTPTTLSASGWTCTPASAPTTTVTCVRATIPATGTTFAQFTVQARVLIEGGTLVGSASVTTSGTGASSDLVPGNNSANLTTTIEAVNDAPVNTIPGAQTTPEDTAMQFSVALGRQISISDGDLDGGTMRLTVVTTNGTIWLGSFAGLTDAGIDPNRIIVEAPVNVLNNALNDLNFLPSLNYSGSVQIGITSNDLGNSGKGGAKIDSDNIVVNVSPVNDPPTPVPHAFTAQEDTPTPMIVLGAGPAFDSTAPDTGETLSTNPPLSGRSAEGGTVGGGGTNPLIYTSPPNFVGTDSFTYTLIDSNGGEATGTVTVIVTNVNDNPTAVPDNLGVVQGVTDARLDVLANDSIAPDTNETLTIISFTQPTSGTVTLAPGSTALLFTPAQAGTDSFTYTISDGNGGSATTTVNLTIGPANAAPVNTVPGAQVIAEDTPIVFAPGTSKIISVADVDAMGANVQLTLTAIQGLITLPTTTGLIFTGTADGTDDQQIIATGTLASLNAALDGVTFTPTPNYYTPTSDGGIATSTDGGAALRIELNDLGNTGVGGAKTDTDEITITITPVNDAPIAVNDAVSITEDGIADRIDVLANDSIGPDFDETLTIVTVGTAMNGTPSLAMNGTRIQYVPNADFYGTDSFTYTISDGNGGTATATVTVTVLNVNDPPKAVDDVVSVAQDSVDNIIDVLANDTYLPDPQETLSILAVSVPQHGTATMTAGKNGVLYTPTPGYIGPDQIIYTISDGLGGVAPAVIIITVGADTDRDGLSDTDELILGTNPVKADTDGDLLADGLEVKLLKTNPLDDDTDDDGLLDGNEDVNRNGFRDMGETDALDPDSDDDGLPDGQERGLAMPQGKDTKLTVFRADQDPTSQTNPLRADTDGGGDADATEDFNKNGRIDADETDPNDPRDDRKDADRDGLTDGLEISSGLDPLDGDSDDDGVLDGADGLMDTDGDGKIDALDPDSDNDGITDGTELGITVMTVARDTDQSQMNFHPDLDPSTTTDPKKKDTDGDGLEDGVEDRNQNGLHDPGETDASKADTDGDGLTDRTELFGENPTSPEVADSDDDGLLDGEEDTNANGRISDGETDPNKADSDGGGEKDGAEAMRGTNPLVAADDLEVRGGGGCSSTPLTAGFALFGLVLLALRRRRSRASLLVLLSLIPSLAFAQIQLNTSIDVQRFKPGVGSQDFLGIQSARVAAHGTPFGQIFFGFVDDPLVMAVPGDKSAKLRLVDSLMFFDVSLGMAIKDHFEVALAIPFSLTRGQSVAYLDPSLSKTTGFALNDLRFVPKYAILDRDKAFQIGVALPISFATGGQKLFHGGGAFVVHPTVMAEVNFPVFRVAANLGVALKTAEQRFINIVSTHEFTYGLGGEFAIMRGDSALYLALTVGGAVAFKATAGGEVPLDAHAGLKYKLGDRLAIEVAGGAGLTRAYGTPKFDVLVSVSYQHTPLPFDKWFKKKEDQRNKSTDNPFATTPPPTDEAQPVAEIVREPVAAPFVDSDRDGVADEDDKCPDKPETINGITDDDGCPDKGPAKVSLTKDRIQLKQKVEFVERTSTLTLGSEILLEQVALLMKANPRVRIRIDVYCTDMKNRDLNADMSVKRAETIRQYLAKAGVPQRRMQAAGWGAQRPLEPSVIELNLIGDE